MSSALIGHTGFVGSNLLRQTHFDDLYNSKNTADIRGKEYGLVVCAAPRADKWWVNQNPEDDFLNICQLSAALARIRTERFILISTIDVYSNPANVDEDVYPDAVTAYGKNRQQLEKFVRAIFPHAQIIRLPGLFGTGLKKNLVYDLIHKRYEFLPHPNSTFQFLDISTLSALIEETQENEYPLWNAVTEPITARRVAETLGRNYPDSALAAPVIAYDVRTKHYGPYLFDAEYVTACLGDYAVSSL